MATDIFALGEFVKASNADDQVGVAELMKRGRGMAIRSSTAILVIERMENQFMVEGLPALKVRIRAGEHKDKAGWVLEQHVARLVTRAVAEAAVRAKKVREEAAHAAAMAAVQAEEVRKEAAHAEFMKEFGPRLTPEPEEKSKARTKPQPKAKPKTFQGGTPAARASQAYRDARKLEAAGKTQEAIKAYQELSKSIFPEARLAAARLKVLLGK